MRRLDECVSPLTAIWMTDEQLAEIAGLPGQYVGPGSSGVGLAQNVPAPRQRLGKMGGGPPLGPRGFLGGGGGTLRQYGLCAMKPW